MQRSIFLVIAGIIVAVGIIIGGAVLWRSVTRPGGILGPAVQPSPSPATQVFQTVSAGNALSPKLDITGNRIRYFDAQESKLKDADFSTARSNTLSESEFRNVFRVIWSPDPNLAVLEYQDELSNRKLTFIDIATDSSTELHPNIRALAWSPDGKQLVYHWRDDSRNENAVYVSAPNTASRRFIMPLQFLAVKLFWIDAERLLIAEKPAPGIQPLVILRNLRDNSTRLVLEGRFGATVLPSPDGDKVLISSTPDAAGTALTTEIFGTDGELLGTLPFPTLAEKCAWGSDSETIYCAIPTLPGADGLPFSYWTGAVASRDTFIAYKFATGEIREIITAPINVDAIDLVVSRAEDAFAFVNRLDGRLTILEP